MLPFSPNVILGSAPADLAAAATSSRPRRFVAGDGTRIVAPRSSSLEGRTDFDAVVFWTFRNMGVGNLLAMIRAADSRARANQVRELETFNLVRSQVAEAQAWVVARVPQIDAGEKAVRSSQDAFAQDLVAFVAVRDCRWN